MQVNYYKTIDFKKYPFAKKIRHHVTATFYIPLSELSIVPRGYPPLIKKEDIDNLFLNGKSANILDIGCGKGKFLLNYALENENDNILGIELRTEPVEWINSVIDGEKIPNARAIWYSVVNGLDFLDDNSIDKIFYLFPDPWPKLRHHKRRVFTVRFLEMIYKKMRKNAMLYLATDVDYVNKEQLKILNQFGKFSVKEVINRDEWNLPITNKERFCLEKNIYVYRHICTK